jgi:hypothetical protein
MVLIAFCRRQNLLRTSGHLWVFLLVVTNLLTLGLIHQSRERPNFVVKNMSICLRLDTSALSKVVVRSLEKKRVIVAQIVLKLAFQLITWSGSQIGSTSHELDVKSVDVPISASINQNVC